MSGAKSSHQAQLDQLKRSNESNDLNNKNHDDLFEIISNKDQNCPSKNCDGSGNIKPGREKHYKYDIYGFFKIKTTYFF